jgi:putative tricarboxylic transport membrane protein
MNDTRPGPDLAGIAGCIAFILVGALALWYSREFSPLGSVFPRTMAILMITLSVAYIAMTLLRPKGSEPQPAGSNWRRGALMVVFLAWSLLLDRVGFLATSIVAFVALLVIANYDRWTPRMAVVYGLVGALVMGGLYSIFRFVLQVPMPAGVLF